MHQVRFSKKETDYLKPFFAGSKHELAEPNVVDDLSVLPKGKIESFEEAINYWFFNQHVSESLKDLLKQLEDGEPADML